MSTLGNFIYTKTKDLFEEQLNAGNVSNEAIVFIEDTKQIWNHGTYFDCSVTSEVFEEYKTKTEQSINNKVDKVSGKQLSTEDFTTALKNKLEDLKIHKKIYRSLSSTPSEDYGWYLIAEIDDTESTLFQVSTGGHSDVIFTVSTGWGGNLGGSLTILNSYFSESNPDDVNEHHAHVTDVRIRKNNNKVQVEVNLRKPTSNNSTYVNIVVSAYTNAGHDNFLQDSLNLASNNDNTLQTFKLKNQALMSGKVITSQILADNLADVATTGSYEDLTDKPVIPAAVTESTVSGWGFTKNTGTYSKPSNGIPKSDLSQEVQQLLNTPSVISQVLQLTTNTIQPIYNTVFKGSDDVYYLDYDSFKQFIELGKHKHFTLLLDSPTSIKSPSSLQILWESGKCPNFYQNDASNPGIHELTFNNYGDDVFYVFWKKHTLGIDTQIFVEDTNLSIEGDEIKVKNYGNAVISDKLADVEDDAVVIKVTSISVSNDSAAVQGDNLIIY